jgi:integrase
MKSKYRFTHRKNRFIQVSFAHLPGKWFSTGTHNQTEAVLWAERKIKEDLKGAAVRKDYTLRDFSHGFFSEDPHNWRKRQESRNRKFQGSFYEQHQGRLENYILPAFGDFLVTAINDVMIDDWFIELRKYKTNKPLADSSRNKILKCFRIIMEEARRQRIIDINPAVQVKLITERGNSREPFTDIEIHKMFPKDEDTLLHYWGNRTWAAYFLVMRDTGFRPGEVAGLTTKTISFKLHGVYTEQSIDFRSREIKNRIKTTNKGYNFKIGLLTNQTLEQLQLLIAEKKLGNDDLLFTINRGNAIIPDSANKHLRLTMERIGIKLNGRTQYSLRHSFETALAGNVEDKILLQLMAHTKFRKEYDHRSPEDILLQLQPALEAIEKRANKIPS